MDTTILIDRSGDRSYTTVKSEATRIDGVHRIRWVGARTNNRVEWWSLVYVGTGRALNKIPLTVDESERLIDELIECQIDWDRIDPDREYPGIPYYVDNLTNEARRLAGV